MCPRKMLDYLASQTPIIASQLPCLKSILNNKNCLFSRAGDIKDLAQKIDYALNHKEEMQEKAKRAYEDIKKLTWQSKTKAVIDLLKNT